MISRSFFSIAKVAVLPPSWTMDGWSTAWARQGAKQMNARTTTGPPPISRTTGRNATMTSAARARTARTGAFSGAARNSNNATAKGYTKKPTTKATATPKTATTAAATTT